MHKRLVWGAIIATSALLAQPGLAAAQAPECVEDLERRVAYYAKSVNDLAEVADDPDARAYKSLDRRIKSVGKTVSRELDKCRAAGGDLSSLEQRAAASEARYQRILAGEVPSSSQVVEKTTADASPSTPACVGRLDAKIARFDDKLDRLESLIANPQDSRISPLMNQTKNGARSLQNSLDACAKRAPDFDFAAQAEAVDNAAARRVGLDAALGAQQSSAQNDRQRSRKVQALFAYVVEFPRQSLDSNDFEGLEPGDARAATGGRGLGRSYDEIKALLASEAWRSSALDVVQGKGTSLDKQAARTDLTRYLNGLTLVQNKAFPANSGLAAVIGETQEQLADVDAQIAAGPDTRPSIAKLPISPMPTAARRDKAVQSELVALFNSMGWDERFEQAVIHTKNFSYPRNALEQVIGRTLGVYMVSRLQDYCLYQDFTVIQEKIGDDQWAAYKRYGTGSRAQLDCDDL